MPPESSTLARPAISRIHSAASPGVRLSSRRCVGAGFERLVQFGAGAHFDLDGQAGRTGALERRPHAAGGGDVVVLDQDGVEEAHAVVGDAAGRGGGFFQRAHARRGLARIEHAARGAGHGIGELHARSVATPLRRCRKLSATRSHSSSVRALPRNRGDDFAIVRSDRRRGLGEIELIHAAARS